MGQERKRGVLYKGAGAGAEQPARRGVGRSRSGRIRKRGLYSERDINASIYYCCPTGTFRKAVRLSYKNHGAGGGNWIARLQAECNRQGYSNQAVDGEKGPNTLAGSPQLGRTSQGNITALIQERLNALGYNCGAADGINGPKTQVAIKAFRRAHNLVQDDIVGQKTWSKLLLLS
ncbi:peptidoglycan-binding domain-containing protein [Extibacter muris]|uniref:Peptidoglycan-binding protein n=1 Tax=Extibacter muris TaxID=1796622 RepID=A0A4R4FGJ7_9FIRM|nr:peptidoglycan-binding domain-containing protein [Extibacter muris]MCU0079796.1 peptidoglycan-binding protein [Extibacter muris]TDA22588.1 peptidoglycan-binding protein [Extibacter muris]